MTGETKQGGRRGRGRDGGAGKSHAAPPAPARGARQAELRRARQAEALRANLRRRKAATDASEPGPGEADGGDGRAKDT